MTNTNKLKGRIFERGYNLSSFSVAMGISRPSLRRKMQGKTDFWATEIKRACVLLQITSEEISEYFFASEVPKTEHTRG